MLCAPTLTGLVAKAVRAKLAGRRSAVETRLGSRHREAATLVAVACVLGYHWFHAYPSFLLATAFACGENEAFYLFFRETV